MERETSCAFTGHRENKLPWRDNENDTRCVELKKRIYDTVLSLYESGIRHFICGMATGCDTYFCEAVLELREQHEDVTLEAAIPCEEQSRLWNSSQKARYNRLALECDYHTVIEHSYTEDCFIRRNHYMVDNACVLVAAYNGSQGGTSSTINYAIRQGVDVIELPIE